MLDVALEVPGGGFARGGLFERYGASTTGVEVLVKALDGATLACCVTAFEEDDVALAGVFGPVLPFEELDLQGALGFFVFFAAHAFLVGVVFPPGLDWFSGGGDKDRIVLVRIVYDVALGSGEVNNWELLMRISHAYNFRPPAPYCLLFSHTGVNKKTPRGVREAHSAGFQFSKD